MDSSRQNFKNVIYEPFNHFIASKQPSDWHCVHHSDFSAIGIGDQKIQVSCIIYRLLYSCLYPAMVFIAGYKCGVYLIVIIIFMLLLDIASKSVFSMCSCTGPLTIM